MVNGELTFRNNRFPKCLAEKRVGSGDGLLFRKDSACWLIRSMGVTSVSRECCVCRPAGDCPRLGGRGGGGRDITNHPIGAPTAQVQPRDAEVTAGGRPHVTGDTGAIMPS